MYQQSSLWLVCRETERHLSEFVLLFKLQPAFAVCMHWSVAWHVCKDGDPLGNKDAAATIWPLSTEASRLLDEPATRANLIALETAAPDSFTRDLDGSCAWHGSPPSNNFRHPIHDASHFWSVKCPWLLHAARQFYNFQNCNRSTNVDQKSTITHHKAYFGLFWVHVSVHMTWCSNLKAPRKMQDYLHHGSCMLGSTNAYQAYCNLAETSSPIWGQGVWWFGHPRIRAWTLPAWTSRMETMRWEQTHSWLPSRYFDSSKCWYLKRSEWDLWTDDIKNDERTQASSTNCQQMMTPIISWKNWLPSRLERACCELWLQSQGHGRTVENIREASTVISIIAGTPGIIWRLNTHWAGVQAATRQTRSDSAGHEGL